MKLRLAAAVVGLIAVASIAYSEYKRAEVRSSGEPIAYLIADSQRELTRLPMAATRISDQEEIAIGDAIAKHYSEALWNDDKKDAEVKAVESYIAHVGNSMVGHTHRKLPYKFHYIPDGRFVNAFALPGGHVFIGQGLINLMDSEDELANVLGHEMEHADLGHCVERVQIEARLRKLRLSSLGGLIEIPYSVFAAGYTKEEELAADANGTQLAVDAKYSPLGAVRMFQTFAKLEPRESKPDTPQGELVEVAASSLEEYFRSHPRSSERAAAIERLINANHWPTPAERELQIAWVGLNELAKSALSQFKYAQAISLAQRSLKLRPSQPSIRSVIYKASMYTGDFSTAANVAEQNFQELPESREFERMFADALAAQGAGNADVRRFQSAISATKHEERTRQMYEIDLDGLRALAGDTSVLQRAILRSKATGTSQNAPAWNAPNVVGEQLIRIAHWQYLAGLYQDAYTTLTEAGELAPSDDEQVALAWAAMQVNKFASADAYFRAHASPEANAGQCVIQWRLEQKDAAVYTYRLIADDPRWSNRAWVSAIYGANIFDTLHQVAAESARRKAQKSK